MTTIAANLQAVRERIAAACVQARRPLSDVALLAVSKTWPAEDLRTAAAAGQHCFGESYVQEAVPKIEALADLTIAWHFIGPLQSNKTRPVAERFDWVHSVDRLKIAQRLAEQRPSDMPPLNVCLQVNVSGEASKSGCAPDDAADIACAIAQLPRLRLRGLMSIPEPSDDIAWQRQQFARVHAIFATLNQAHGLNLDTLSMGMSHDLEAAIAEGSTMVRIGSAIFGERTYA